MTTMAADTKAPELGESLARALQRDRPLTMADREADPSMVKLVLNPGCHSSIGGRKFGPGDYILVDEEQAERLTTPTEFRPYAAARYLDEPEPDAAGNWAQPHGAGRYHPDSKHHEAPAERRAEPARGQFRNTDGELAEGLRARRDVGVVTRSGATGQTSGDHQPDTGGEHAGSDPDPEDDDGEGEGGEGEDDAKGEAEGAGGKNAGAKTGQGGGSGGTGGRRPRAANAGSAPGNGGKRS